MIDHPGIAAFIHALFEYSGIAVGVAWYRAERRASGQGGLSQPGAFALLVGLLLGAGLGNKLAFIAEQPRILQLWRAGEMVMPGQSIVGGLVGGLIGVEIAKRLSGQRQSTGDPMVRPIAVGLALGRVGCFVAGLHDDTYGLPTTLPWGVDFGDGLARHPTQLYDLLVVLLLAWAVHERFTEAPGLAFKLFLAGYLAWRVGIDYLKPVPYHYVLGLSGIQWLCLLTLIVYLPVVRRTWMNYRQRAFVQG